MSTELLTNKDLAAVMGWSVHTVHMRRYRGDSLPRAIAIGNVIRYRAEDVQAWLDEHSEKAEAAGGS